MALGSFATRVLADAPIGYWRLGEIPGSISAADVSGHGNNGTYSSGVTLGQPSIQGGDTAVLFDGNTGRRIVVLNSASLNPPTITMEAKIRWDGPNGFQQRILEKSSFAELAQYGLSILPDGHVQVELRTSAAASSIAVKSIGVVAQAVETHVVATYDGNVIRIYLNGVLDPSETPAAGSISPKPPTPANLTESGLGIGNQIERDRPFKGLIDEVALYATALSAKQIGAHLANVWQHIGHANHVVAMTALNNKLFCATKDNRLWWRDPVGTDVNWQHIGHANHVVAMTALNNKLFCATKDNRLWWRDPVGTEVNWQHIGHANDVVAMAALNNKLFCATKDNRLWWRDPVGTDVSWQHIGHANDVVAMTAINNKLFCATKDNRLWWRDPVGVDVNWQHIGHANDVVAMAALNNKLFCATKDNRLWWRDPT